MINYPLPPSPDLACHESNYMFRTVVFNEEEIANIVRYGERVLQLESGTVINLSSCDKSVRNSQVSWIPINQETQWIYDRIAHVARELNGQFFQLDLYGFVEPIQYTVYEGSENTEEQGHYVWHIDKGNIGGSPRKLSIVIQLSDPSEYDGGNLEIAVSNNPEVLKKQQGMLYAFPSYTLHRVTPVTKGVRRTLVVWIAGPKFK